MVPRQISAKITSTISITWYLTTKSDGICENQVSRTLVGSRRYTHACNFKLPLLPVAGGFCGMMIFPPCPHALHGREPSCIMRWNVHICSLYKAGHSRGARGQPSDTGAPL